jgi:alkaline phosphatase
MTYWTAAALAADNLAVEQFRTVGLVKTASSSSKVTDSAAAATAFASGVRTYNGAIGVDPDTLPVRTVFEVARDRGMATGLVATSSITHATPAAFAAHTASRQQHFEIARQLAEFGLTVFLGGGLQYFEAQSRPDSLDLMGDVLGGYAHAYNDGDLSDLDLTSTDRLVGLFADEHMPSATDRTPTLPEMTIAALEILDRDPDGFVLMVESSQPDWLGHDNEPLAAITAEMLDFDKAIREGLEYQERNPETLIVVVADHETGGLSVQLASAPALATQTASKLDTLGLRLRESAELAGSGDQQLIDNTLDAMDSAAVHLRSQLETLSDAEVLVARYTSGGHTAELIPLFASGPGAARFGGLIENWHIGQLLLDHVGNTNSSLLVEPSR